MLCKRLLFYFISTSAPDIRPWTESLHAGAEKTSNEENISCTLKLLFVEVSIKQAMSNLLIASSWTTNVPGQYNYVEIFELVRLL